MSKHKQVHWHLTSGFESVVETITPHHATVMEEGMKQLAQLHAWDVGVQLRFKHVCELCHVVDVTGQACQISKTGFNRLLSLLVVLKVGGHFP
eukprot:m.247633 g.247633  ORF g.247633 m.247633 type:complete len:93 (+) comp17487_c0_seq6:1805-2083(+)